MGSQGVHSGALCVLVRKDFIAGASWMLLECWGQMPELAWVDVPVWGWLCRSLEDWLELWSEGSREVVRRHPLLSSVQVSNTGDGMLV